MPGGLDQVVTVLLTGNADQLKAVFAESSEAAAGSSAVVGESYNKIGKAATLAFAASICIGLHRSASNCTGSARDRS